MPCLVIFPLPDGVREDADEGAEAHRGILSFLRVAEADAQLRDSTHGWAPCRSTTRRPSCTRSSTSSASRPEPETNRTFLAKDGGFLAMAEAVGNLTNRPRTDPTLAHNRARVTDASASRTRRTRSSSQPARTSTARPTIGGEENTGGHRGRPVHVRVLARGGVEPPVSSCDIRGACCDLLVPARRRSWSLRTLPPAPPAHGHAPQLWRQ